MFRKYDDWATGLVKKANGADNETGAVQLGVASSFLHGAYMFVVAIIALLQFAFGYEPVDSVWYVPGLLVTTAVVALAGEPLIPLFLNYVGNRIQGEDHAKITSLLNELETSGAEWIFSKVGYASLFITLCLLAGGNTFVLIALLGAAGFHFLLGIAGKVYRINKSINVHINDKDAHRGDS